MLSLGKPRASKMPSYRRQFLSLPVLFCVNSFLLPSIFHVRRKSEVLWVREFPVCLIMPRRTKRIKYEEKKVTYQIDGQKKETEKEERERNIRAKT